ncbi:MAG: acireductone synthase [Bryobacteraceae bacterium]|jgi:enolase-phosphatase E1
MRAVLLDIEGTVCPIHFVSSQLFPWVLDHVDQWLRAHPADAAVLQIAEQIAEQRVDGELADHVRALIRREMSTGRKYAPLKELQGKMWHEGYVRGELRAPVFPDVKSAFHLWNAAGVRIAIYSSGSELAQRDFFRYSVEGDLARYIHSYFDTRYGAKREAASYQHIAAALQVAPEDVVFVSDVRAELDAARAAGMRTVLAVRPGNPPQNAMSLRSIGSFDEI